MANALIAADSINSRFRALNAHGVTCAAATLHDVVFLSIYMAENADLQPRTMPLASLPICHRTR